MALSDGCSDCGLDINDEYAYMVHWQIWREAGRPKGCMCIGCLEARLGRVLTAEDFNWEIPLTYRSSHGRSERLISRMRFNRDGSPVVLSGIALEEWNLVLRELDNV